jgi:hypothetical protein
VRLIALVALLSVAQGLVVDSAAQRSPTWTVGGDDAVGTEIGNRVRVFRLPNHLLLIERDAPFLKLVTADGRVRQQIGRLGGGPGEFRQPSSVYFDSTRRELFVADGAAVRVSVYALGDSLRFLRSLTAPEPSLEGLCRIRGRWFGLVRNSATMLREFDVEGDRFVVRRAFAEPKSLHPLSAVPAVRNEASGSLICDERRGELVVVSRTLGEVHRIDLEGQRHRIQALPGFAAMRWVVIDGMPSIELRGNDTYDHVLNVVPLAGDFLVAVARTTRAPEGVRIDGYRSYALGALAATTPPELEAWSKLAEFGAGVVCLREEPVPSLAMFEGRRCPAR